MPQVMEPSSLKTIIVQSFSDGIGYEPRARFAINIWVFGFLNEYMFDLTFEVSVLFLHVFAMVQTFADNSLGFIR